MTCHGLLHVLVLPLNDCRVCVTVLCLLPLRGAPALRRCVSERSCGKALLCVACHAVSVALTRVLCCSVASCCQVHPAPGPEEVNWQALWFNHQQRVIRGWLTAPFIVIVVLLPVSGLTSAISMLNSEVGDTAPYSWHAQHRTVQHGSDDADRCMADSTLAAVAPLCTFSVAVCSITHIEAWVLPCHRPPTTHVTTQQHLYAS